jgi:hypothetical protein
MVGLKALNSQLGAHLFGVLAALLTMYTITWSTNMNIKQLVTQATTPSGRLDLQHYTNLVLTEACRLIKETPITGAYTTFDQAVAQSQRAECFQQVYNQIVKNIEDATP